MDSKKLHDDAILVDAHHDLLLLVTRDHQAGQRNTFEAEWIPELRRGGVDVQVCPIFIEEEWVPEGSLRRALQMVDALHVEIENNADAAFCLTADDIDAAVDAGKIAFVLSLEGAEPIGPDVGMLRNFYRLGLRMFGFTWNRRTALADGIAETATGGGLTSVGVEMLLECERLGIVVDLTHMSEPGFWHAIELVTRTPIASHSNMRGVWDHPRNLTDDQLKALAAKGGVAGLLLHPMIIDPENPTIERCVDHLVYGIDLVGDDHIGLGPDFVKDFHDRVQPTINNALMEREQLFSSIKDLAYPSDLPRLTDAMVESGLSDETIRKVLGGNFMRVFREVMGRPVAS